MSVTRRPLVLSALALIGVGIAGAIAVEGPHLLKMRVHSPYDDIIGQLEDHTQAAKVGDAVIAGLREFDAAKSANALRTHKATLAQMAKADLDEGRLIEAGGWVLPQTLAVACALVADQARRVG